VNPFCLADISRRLGCFLCLGGDTPLSCGHLPLKGERRGSVIFCNFDEVIRRVFGGIVGEFLVPEKTKPPGRTNLDPHTHLITKSPLPQPSETLSPLSRGDVRRAEGYLPQAQKTSKPTVDARREKGFSLPRPPAAIQESKSLSSSLDPP